MKKKRIDTSVKSETCWFTAHVRPHPDTKCVYSGDELFVATNGKKLWISCEGCKKTWPVKDLG